MFNLDPVDAAPRPAPTARPQPPRVAPAGPLAGQVAVVTGSESGIGRETARALCAQGAAVVLNGRHPERLEQTRQVFAAAGFAVASCQADVTHYAACEQLVDVAIQAFGRLDILVTNASISMRAYFADVQPEVFRQVLDSNVYGSVYPLKAALLHLIKTQGSVTFISSISALNGMPSGSAYCAGKAAVANLAHTLRLELACTSAWYTWASRRTTPTSGCSTRPAGPCPLCTAPRAGRKRRPRWRPSSCGTFGGGDDARLFRPWGGSSCSCTPAFRGSATGWCGPRCGACVTFTSEAVATPVRPAGVHPPRAAGPPA